MTLPLQCERANKGTNNNNWVGGVLAMTLAYTFETWLTHKYSVLRFPIESMSDIVLDNPIIIVSERNGGNYANITGTQTTSVNEPLRSKGA